MCYMNNIDIMSILLTVGTAFLGFAVSFVQYIISRINEKKKTEIKYIINSNSSNVNYKNISVNDNIENTTVEENYLNRLLESYHNQALQQASIQFWFSIIASVLGFAFIFVIIFFEENKTWYEYVLKTLPGAIVEIISVLFINQARETRERATNLFKELNYDSKIEKSVEIVDTIDNSDIKSDVKAKIALHIIGINDNDNR